VDVVVRRIRSDEGSALRAIRLAALRDAPEAFGSNLAREEPLADGDWDERAHEGAEGEERAAFVAELDGRWVGLVGGFRPHAGSPRVELISMWTDPAERGRGIGRALVGAVVDHARATGAAQVDLWVMRDNPVALALYEACGFRPGEGERPPTSDACRDEHWLVLPL
jgi:GNAT superfamily N-acetyltransferase